MTTTVQQPYLQATRSLARPAADVAATLRTRGPALVAAATERALASLQPLLRDGSFRRAAAPRVETAILDRGPATIRVTWNRNEADRWPPPPPFATGPTSSWWRTDEEETGWPTATLDVLVEPRRDGCQLATLSDRPPGTDQSTNRIDKQLRDRIARAAFERFLDELAASLEAAGGDDEASG
jgi:hypothetical protein